MTHCVALCAFLVPANLLVSLQILLFAAFERPRYQLWLMAAVSALYASALVLHDFSLADDRGGQSPHLHSDICSRTLPER